MANCDCYTGGFDLRGGGGGGGGDFQRSSPLSVLAWVVDNTVVWLAGCLKGQPTKRLSNS